MGDEERPTSAGSGFTDRVLIYFLAQVVTAGLGIFNGFFLARLIGPSAKGDYYLLTLLPSTLMVLSQLGLPQAFGFFSARGATKGLIKRTVMLTAWVSVPIVILMLALVPTLHGSVLDGVDPALIVIPFLTLPLLLNATFTTGIVVGRQASRWLAGVNVAVSLITTPLILLLVGILGLGLWGAILAYAITVTVQAIGFLIASRSLTRKVPAANATSVPYVRLLRYGLPFFPASLTQYFANRADVYLLAILIPDPSAPLGFYSMAVGMAELVFFFPNAVSTFFFPHVAGSTREDADRQVPMVSRVTLMLTGAVALAMVPFATLAIVIILPAFRPTLPALYVLLPGVVAFSVSKVLSGYLSGLGRTGLTSSVSVTAFMVNVALNLILIPRFGIVGASAASLISYTLSSIMYSVVGARLARARWTDFWIPRATDVQFAIRMSKSLFGRIIAGVKATR